MSPASTVRRTPSYRADDPGGTRVGSTHESIQEFTWSATPPRGPLNGMSIRHGGSKAATAIRNVHGHTNVRKRRRWTLSGQRRTHDARDTWHGRDGDSAPALCYPWTIDNL